MHFKNFWSQSSVFALDLLVARFNETRATRFRKCVAKEGIAIPNSLKNFKTFWLQSSVFASEKQPEKLNFQSFFLSLGNSLVATFNETRTPTSRKYVAEDGIVMPNY